MRSEKLVESTGLKTLPNGWEIDRLDKIFDILDNNRVPLSSEERMQMRGDIPYYGANGVVDHIDKWIFDEPLLLMAEDGGYFDEFQSKSISYLVEGKSWVNNHAHVLRIRDGNNLRFFYYATAHRDIRSFINGTTRTKLNQEDLRSILLPTPPKDQQDRIAEVLTSIDGVIKATQAVIEQTHRLKDALLQELLSDGLPGQYRKVKSTKHLINIPADWQILSLEKIGDGRRPALRTGPFGSSLKTEHFTTSGRPILTIGSLGEGEILTDDLFYVDEAKAAELREYEVEPGDVVFSRVADVGRSVTIPEWAGGWIISSNLMRIAVDKSRFDPWFIRQSLVHSRHLKKQMRRLTADAGREIVNSNVLSDLLFPMPDRDEQNQIAEIIRRVDERIWEDREILSQLVKTKFALSQGLLTGRIPVRV